MKLSTLISRLVAFSIFLFALMAGPSLRAADGPTPFPDASDEAAWPGKGPVRVFPYMNDNRAWFWTQRDKDRGAVVFVGDSLIEGWRRQAMAQMFPDLRIANRGIAGDCSRSVLFRFREDAMDLEPHAIVICVGSSDLSAHGAPSSIEENISTMIAQSRAANPALPIILCQLPPRDAANAPVLAGALTAVNKRIADLGTGKENMVVLDLYTPFATADGKPLQTLFKEDKLQLSAAGYQKWADMLKPIMARLGVKTLSALPASDRNNNALICRK